jgi:hypothetical protein
VNSALTALLMVTVSLPARGDMARKEVNHQIADGIVTLTKQTQAVTLADISRVLALDPMWYQRSESAEYWRRAAEDAQKKSPIVLFAFTNVLVSSPVYSLSSPPVQPAQSIKILFERDRCISVKALAERLHVQFKAYPPPIMSSMSRAGGFVATLTTEFQSPTRLFYSVRLEATPGASKTEALENALTLDDECSQQVRISKTFDYDYWNQLCPFEYSDQLVDSTVIPAIRGKYGSQYTEFALHEPNMKDYGSFIALRFHKSAAGPNQENEFAVEVDRCTRKVTRTWEVPVAALRNGPPP